MVMHRQNVILNNFRLAHFDLRSQIWTLADIAQTMLNFKKISYSVFQPNRYSEIVHMVHYLHTLTTLYRLTRDHAI